MSDDLPWDLEDPGVPRCRLDPGHPNKGEGKRFKLRIKKDGTF